MEKFKELHFQVSGKKTRPDKTWEIMLNQIINDEGYLFTLKKGTENISFLYSGKYKIIHGAGVKSTNLNLRKNLCQGII